jgi:hypothetical protein
MRENAAIATQMETSHRVQVNKIMLILSTLLFVCFSFDLQQGSHDAIYYYRITAFQKIGFITLFYLFANRFFYRNEYEKVVFRIFKWFILFYAIILSWYFLPVPIVHAVLTKGSPTYLDYTIHYYMYVWTFIGICLILYYIFFKRSKLL